MGSTHARVIVLCGVVGSGKTYFSTALCRLLPNWQRVSQDDLGSRPACEVAVKDHLMNHTDVIIDRCNFDRKQRATWIRIAKTQNAKIVALELKTPIEVCRSRILAREAHPTGVIGSFGSGILNSFVRDYRSPVADEGFSKVYTVNMSSDIEWNLAMLSHVLQKLNFAHT